MMTRNRAIFIIGSVIVSVGSVYFILRDIPLSDLLKSIRVADPGLLLLALAFTTLSMFTRGIRWWILLGGGLPLATASHLMNVTFLGNQLPLRLGEAARIALAKREQLPVATSTASIVVERLMDTLIVVLMIAAVLSQLPDAPDYVSERASQFGLLALFAFVCLLALSRFPHRVKGGVAGLLAVFPALSRLPLQKTVDRMLDGLASITDLRTLFFSALWTVIAWASSLATFACLHFALGIDVNLALSVPLGVSLAALGIALPFSIAAVGPFEAAIILTGQLTGMDSLSAISLGFLFHGVSVFGYIIWGIVGLLALGVSPTTAFDASGRAKSD